MSPSGTNPTGRSTRLAQAAAGVGVLGVLAGGAILATARRPETYHLCQNSLLTFRIIGLLSLPAIVLSYIAFRKVTRGSGQGRAWAIVGIATCLVTLLFLGSASTPDALPCGPHPAATVAAAVRSLQAINNAETTYASSYDTGYSSSLKALAPPQAGSKPSASAAGLIDEVLSRNQKDGYIFSYMPGERDEGGHIVSYSVSGRPRTYWRRSEWSAWSFLTDQSGVIRYCEDDRAATSRDPELDPKAVSNWR